jgi:phosphoglycolate phosphatase
VIRKFREMPLLKVARELGISPWQVPRLVVQGRKAMQQRMGEIKPFEGIPEVLASLHADGYEMYMLSSNSAHNVQRFLNSHHLGVYFKRVYGGVGLLGKAGAIKRVMRQNGLHAGQCVYIGDEARDVDGAKRANVQVIGVSWGYNDQSLLLRHEPDVVVETPAQLLDYIKSL